MQTIDNYSLVGNVFINYVFVIMYYVIIHGELGLLKEVPIHHADDRESSAYWKFTR